MTPSAHSKLDHHRDHLTRTARAYRTGELIRMATGAVGAQPLHFGAMKIWMVRTFSSGRVRDWCELAPGRTQSLRAASTATAETKFTGECKRQR